MSKNKEKIVTILALVVLVLVTVGISYAAFTYIGQGQRENTINTGNLTFVYDEANAEGNGIKLENATPTSDELGMNSRNQGEVFEFSVTASTKGAPIYYEIYVTKQDSSTLPEKIIKTYLTHVQGEEETGVPNTLTNENVNTFNKLGISQVPNQEGGRTLYQEMIPEGESNYNKTFRYRMWIADTATEVDSNGVWKYSNMSFTVRVNVYASNEQIPFPLPGETDPNPPVLVQGYIPVVYSEEQSSWVKADTSSEWYDYSSQEWANAVTVTEANREMYMNANPGTIVSMDDINTMWVWIPRYEYMYIDLEESHAGSASVRFDEEIKIKFLDGKTTIASDGENYKVHPAFTFGNDELEGFWYAKFETTGTLANACINESCNASTVTVKPGLRPLRDQTVSSFFYMARSMQMNNASTFGFSKTDSDLHMTKNSEWGAVAYLSQSKYGKYGNPKYEGNSKKIVKNHYGYTGNGPKNVYVENDACSTTGNITGIYDMSGGLDEYVMGVLADSSGKPRSGGTTSSNSGFNGSLSSGRKTDGVAFPESKYYDLYTNGDINYPWIMRGNYYASSSASIFDLSTNMGNGNYTWTTRFVQTPFK